MFDVSFPELMVVGVVALLVLGPERLPVALRTMGLWLGRLRRSFVTIKAEVEREIGMDEIRRQLHNESIVRDLKRLEHDIRTTANPAAPKTASASTVTQTDTVSPVAAAANEPPREAATAITPRAGVAATHDGTASSQS